MEELDKHLIQGLVERGYGRLRAARFLLLEVADAAPARAYLRALRDVNTMSEEPGRVALQVALTAPGLAALGVPPRVRATFAREFLEGMDDEVRAVSLGDQGDNDPAHWRWGRKKRRPEDPEVHVLLLVYAKDEPALEARLGEERARLAPAFRVLAEKPTALLRDQKEHFGWKDGLSTPTRSPLWTRPMRWGEFVLGYENEYENYTESPTVSFADDPDDVLPLTPDGAAKDLGRNGTYLVYREMSQDVLRFWAYLADHSREPGADPVASAIALGARMVGRWPGGAPVIVSPERDDPAKSKENAFTYHADRNGTGCPLGSHIRRANPRDLLLFGHDADDSTEMVRKHQILRRGRPYGKPVVESMDPRDILARRDQPDGEDRGLHFICLVGHIGRQFEFVQRAWIQSANFAGLFRDADPIVGARRPAPDENANDEFTRQAEPLRRKYTGLPRFTQLVGGAYFFLPSIPALHYLARDP